MSDQLALRNSSMELSADYAVDEVSTACGSGRAQRMTHAARVFDPPATAGGTDLVSFLSLLRNLRIRIHSLTSRDTPAHVGRWIAQIPVASPVKRFSRRPSARCGPLASAPHARHALRR